MLVVNLYVGMCWVTKSHDSQDIQILEIPLVGESDPVLCNSPSMWLYMRSSRNEKLVSVGMVDYRRYSTF